MEINLVQRIEMQSNLPIWEHMKNKTGLLTVLLNRSAEFDFLFGYNIFHFIK